MDESDSANELESLKASSSTSSTGPVVPKLSLSEFDQWTEDNRTDTNKMPNMERVREYDITCLLSEAGEVADARKLYLRTDQYGNADFGAYSENILLELGDVLHYICRIAADHGFTLQDVADANIEKLVNREYYGKGNKGKRS